MGTSLWTHLGPYVLWRPSKEEQEDTIRTCTNNDCPKSRHWIHEPFCSACGSRVANVQRVTLQPASLDDLIGEALYPLHLSVVPEGMLYLAANVRRPGDPNPKRDQEFRDLTDLDTETEIAWFQVAFAPELKTLAENGEIIKVGWGSFRYYH